MKDVVRHTITDGLLEIGLGELPVVLEYGRKGCVSLSGGEPPALTLYDRRAKRLLAGGEDFCVEYERRIRSSCAEFIGKVSVPAGGISFLIRFAVEAGVFSVGWESLREEGELELVAIEFPRLISAGGSDPSGRLALTARGGRLVNPAECACGRYEHRYNWVLDSFCGCSVLYNRGLTAAVRLHSLDDTLLSEVYETAEGKRAALGVSFRHRYTMMDRPYRKVRGAGAPCEADEKTYPIEESFAVHPSSSLDIRLFRHGCGDPDTGWVFGMKELHKTLPPKRTGLYRGRFVYKIYIGNPGQPVMTTFAQALDIIKAVHERTGGAGQICYLVGFQHEGHDSMYPDVFTANEKAGGQAELERLMREAEAYNAIVSFHDNYDDAYRVSPMWDESDIAVDNAGRLLRGGRWNGEQAYWISMPQYARGKSRARMERTLGKYPVKTTYHLDVLTASVFRLDFRAGAPKGKDDDLEARLAVLRHFGESGVDASSEACGLPFIGGVSYFWHMMRVPRPVHKGDRRIPAVPFLIHGKADYAGSSAEGRGILDALLYGAFFSYDVTAETPMKLLTDAYYLIQAPLNRLRDEEAVEYAELSGAKRVTYASGSYVLVDFESGEFEAVIGGRAWVRNGTAFVPADDGGYIAYVAFEEEAGAPSFEIPQGWEGKAVVCRAMYGGGQDIRLAPEDGRIVFGLPAGIAHRIFTE